MLLHALSTPDDLPTFAGFFKSPFDGLAIESLHSHHRLLTFDAVLSICHNRFSQYQRFEGRPMLAPKVDDTKSLVPRDKCVSVAFSRIS